MEVHPLTIFRLKKKNLTFLDEGNPYLCDFKMIYFLQQHEFECCQI